MLLSVVVLLGVIGYVQAMQGGRRMLLNVVDFGCYWMLLATCDGVSFNVHPPLSPVPPHPYFLVSLGIIRV